MEEETSEELEIEKQGSNGGNSKKSMIWRVGKKIVIGGVMITSAPFLLPPLIVVSTVGFAFSVPFGLVFAGYACTEKVMSKLLSRPRVEEFEEEEEGDGLDREEKELEDDMKESLEMIGGEYGAGEVEAEQEDEQEESKGNMDGMMEEKGYEEDYSVEEDFQKGIQLERSEYPNQDMVGVMDNVEQVVKEVVEEEGGEGIGGLVEEGVGGISDDEEEKLVGEVGGFVGDEKAEQKEIPVEDAFDGTEEIQNEGDKRIEGFVQEGLGGFDDEEGEKLVGDVRGLMGDERAEQREIPVEDAFDGVVQENGGDEKVDDIKEEETVMDKEVDTPVEEPTGSMGEGNKKLVGEAEGGDQETTDVYSLDKSETNEAVPTEERGVDFEGDRNEVNDAITIQDEEPFEGVVERVDENGIPDNKLEPIQVEEMVEDRIVDRIIDEMVEEEKPVVDTKEMMEERTEETEDNMASDDIEGKEVTVVPTKEEVKVIPVKDNAREIADESGLDLFDVETATLEQDNFVAGENGVSPATDSYYISRSVEFSSVPRHVRLDFSSATEEPTSDGLNAESVDSVVHPVSPKSVDTQPAELLLPEMETATPLKEVLYTEERIWELMNAVRKIVGYKGAVQPNIAEELKALYTFTGVEPPVALKDPLELVEANDKLRLLMAIIGVK